MPLLSPSFELIFRALTAHQVQFIVVGGVCGVIQGAMLITTDLDLVHLRTPENVDRLLAALAALHPYYRGQGDRRIPPKASYLLSPGHQLRATDAGHLDLLGTVTQGRGYEDLLPHTEVKELAPDLSVRVLDLPTLIVLKEETGREKDKAVLGMLKHTLEERMRHG